MRDLFRTLSQEPEHAWPDGVLHHGARLALLLLLAILTYTVFPLSAIADFPNLERGMLAEEEIIAEIPFTVYKTPVELAQERDEAANAVPAIFRYDSTAVDTMRLRIDGMLTRIDSAAATEEAAAALRRVLAAYSLPTEAGVVALLTSESNRTMLRRALRRIVDQEVPRGIASPTDIEGLRAPQVRVVRDGEERTIPRDSVLTPTSTLFQVGDDVFPANAPVGLRSFLQLVLIRQFTPSLRLDRQATDLAVQAARMAVQTVRREVIQGERVIAARERLQDGDIERLRAYQARLAELGRIERGPAHLLRVGGSILLNLLVLAGLGTSIFLFRRDVYRDLRHLLLLSAMLVAVTAVAGGIVNSELPAALIPIAFPALVVAVLWDGRLALTYALFLVVLLVAQGGLAGPSARILLFAGAAAAAMSVRAVRSRAQALMLGLVIAGAYAAAALGLGLVLDWEASEIVRTIAWGSVNGLASAVFALGLLPVFETVTGITSDQTLLELSDLNRPLLKRLSLEAPGTYAHSINVANLAEAAARAIGANPLLARAGAYYHDIGKMLAPQYYIENQARGRNPHDEMDPATSAAIVRQHVIDGSRLADQSKLPEVIRCCIREHHGTQKIGFFFEQAKQRRPDSPPDPADFQYPGPRPRSRETAILMLADSVESAAKVLPDPTPESIRGLVDRIVEAKIVQNQLDEAPLTFGDLTRIKEQFSLVLNGMYHHRLDYPNLPRRAQVRDLPAGEAEPAVRR